MYVYSVLQHSAVCIVNLDNILCFLVVFIERLTLTKGQSLKHQFLNLFTVANLLLVSDLLLIFHILYL